MCISAYIEIQPFVWIAVKPKNHKPENQIELMGVRLS